MWFFVKSLYDFIFPEKKRFFCWRNPKYRFKVKRLDRGMIARKPCVKENRHHVPEMMKRNALISTVIFMLPWLHRRRHLHRYFFFAPGRFFFFPPSECSMSDYATYGQGKKRKNILPGGWLVRVSISRPPINID